MFILILWIDFCSILYQIADGKFERSIDEVSCGDAWLIDIPLENEDDMNLSLKVDTEEITEIGMINLYGVSNGIKVKSNYEGALFVQHDIDESCTRVRVRW